MDDALNQLEKLETSLWQAQYRYDCQHIDKLLSSDFAEFGASGRHYSREDILSLAGQSIGVTLPLEAFEARWLSTDIALVTYRCKAVAINNESYRSSVWRWNAQQWFLAFHQGTPAADLVNNSDDQSRV